MTSRLPSDEAIAKVIMSYTGHDEFRITLTAADVPVLLPIVKEKLLTLGGLSRHSTGIREALAHALMSSRWLHRNTDK
ncbi:MAG: hypothetical protein G01um101425_139 [Candidatus Peregrinibacteria bacterium Gr01-1014_25]|nr:MAG: hypothetical protein G01um101425_139 [Candidatus Peregrinibacteria bacterium Gr01-1014_25]